VVEWLNDNGGDSVVDVITVWIDCDSTVDMWRFDLRGSDARLFTIDSITVSE